MNTSSKSLLDRTERLLTRDKNYKAILERLFLLDNQHFKTYFSDSHTHYACLKKELFNLWHLHNARFKYITNFYFETDII